MKRLTLLLALLTSLTAFAVDTGDLHRALSQLDYELERRHIYVERRNARIDSLHRKLYTTRRNDKPELYLRIGESFTGLDNDSALIHFRQGIECCGHGDDSLKTVMSLKRLALLPLAGLGLHAAEEYAAIDTLGMSPQMLREYFDAGRQMYFYLAEWFADYPRYAEPYRRHSDSCRVQLLGYLPEGSQSQTLALAEMQFQLREYERAARTITPLLDQIDPSNNLYARAAHLMAVIERLQGNEEGYLYYLTRSAISDIKSGTLEVSSLQELGSALFRHNETERAYRYLTVAVDNAVACHAQMRIIESAEALPLIERVHSLNSERASRRLVLSLILVALALLAVVAAVFYLRREMRREQSLRENLAQANSTKDIYLARFLDLCSMYMDKLNRFSGTIHAKIAAGKVNDLDKMVRSGKFVEEQSREFYEVFDDAFLHIYPNFISEVNALLRPDAQIELKSDERMNTDLRILAFMRLGIEDSTRIAQVLNYSVNTIYTYRNKLRARAIKRETFEDEVRNIGAIK